VETVVRPVSEEEPAASELDVVTASVEALGR
jgi:hypothetical protein